MWLCCKKKLVINTQSKNIVTKDRWTVNEAKEMRITVINMSLKEDSESINNINFFFLLKNDDLTRPTSTYNTGIASNQTGIWELSHS